MLNKPKIYLGLTTTEKSDWREKIKEIIAMDLKEIALFTTGLNPEKRQELYQLLAKTPIEYIPFVHLRHDSTQEEIDLFKNKYKTKYFNTHATPDSLEHYASFPDRKECIYLENTDQVTDDFYNNLHDYAGICVDFAHLEDYGKIQKDSSYDKFEQVMSKSKVDFCHISSVSDKPFFRHYDYHSFNDTHYSKHLMERLEDMDYLKKYLDVLPEILGLELENSLPEQLEAKKYIEENILQ